jgi:glutamate racemase
MGMGLSLEAEGGVDAVIAACNTTSALVLDRWQEACEGVPVLGMIEPTLQAIVDSGARSVGIIGTEATVASGVHRAGLARLDPAMRVWSMACPGWVEAVETGQWDSPSLERSMQDVGARVAAEGSELLVYGCTHFPWLDAMVAQYLPSSVVRLDPAEAVAKALVALLGCGSGGKLGESEHSGVWHFYATSAPEVAMLRARSLIGLDCPFGWLETADTVDS